MRKMFLALAATAALAGCTTAEKDAGVGGLVGAGAGALITGDAGGAIVGGVVGAASGVLIGSATRKGDCVYRDRRGRRYVSNCPAGYR